MENGTVYWVVDHYDDYADHASDRGWKRYNDEQFFVTEAAAQEEVDRLNHSTVQLNIKELQEARAAYDLRRLQWEQKKADHDFLVANSRRTGEYKSFGDFTPPHPERLMFQVDSITWSEEREGDKITIEAW